MKLLDRISQTGLFVMDLLFSSIGILLLIHPSGGLFILYILTVILSFLIPLRLIFLMCCRIRQRSRIDCCFIALNLLFGLVILLRPEQFLKWTAVFYGWRAFGYGILMLVSYYVTVHDRLSGPVSALLSGLLSVPLGIFLILSSDLPIRENMISAAAGFYFLGYGIIGLLFHFRLLLSRYFKNLIPRSLSGPTIINAFLPLEMHIALQQLKQSERLLPAGKSEHADLHVYFYLKGKGPESLGHIDISYRGTVYSYGNHDPQHRSLFGLLGDGVLIVSDAASFLQENITTGGKTVIDYGIRLSKAGQQVLEERLRELLSRCTAWKCAAEEARCAGRDMNDCHDYASRVYKETFCRMYKFTSGQFRTYFIAGANCVTLADTLIRSPNLELIDFSHLITPGTYLAFLNSEYLRANSSVISRSIYEAGIREANEPQRKTAAA